MKLKLYSLTEKLEFLERVYGYFWYLIIPLGLIGLLKINRTYQGIIASSGKHPMYFLKENSY